MKLYQIDWYPKIPFDCEKCSTMVLASNRTDAWKIADTKFKGVQVVAVYAYADIAGGDEGNPDWAEYKIENGVISPVHTF